MDSKNIYISSQTYLKRVAWIKNNADTEWIYIGNNILRVELLINTFFESELELYFVTSRHNSIQVDREQILENAKEYFGKSDFVIWDLRFNRVIEFNKIEVYRNGTYVIK